MEKLASDVCDTPSAWRDYQVSLWLKSNTAAAWLDRRTTFTRSIAVMSMVGYLLGLGDRHPSNLILDENTYKIVH